MDYAVMLLLLEQTTYEETFKTLPQGEEKRKLQHDAPSPQFYCKKVWNSTGSFLENENLKTINFPINGHSKR